MGQKNLEGKKRFCTEKRSVKHRRVRVANSTQARQGGTEEGQTWCWGLIIKFAGLIIIQSDDNLLDPVRPSEEGVKEDYRLVKVPNEDSFESQVWSQHKRLISVCFS